MSPVRSCSSTIPAAPWGPQRRSAQIFVAVPCASNYTSAETTFGQGVPDRIASHVRAFAYFGGKAGDRPAGRADSRHVARGDDANR